MSSAKFRGVTPNLMYEDAEKRSYGLNVCSGSRREPDTSTETVS
jgi:hypothetical protein